MRSLFCVACVAWLSLACGDDDDEGGTTTDAAQVVADADPLAPDADPLTPDAAPPGTPDGSPPVGETVNCGVGGATCDLPGQACCDDATDMCIDAVGGACTGKLMTCDGAEDCSDGEDCCYEPGSGSACFPAGCATGLERFVMCHGVFGDCMPAQVCCGTSGGPAADIYQICTSGPCPQ